MAAVIELIIAAADRSGPAFQSASTNVTTLGRASDVTADKMDTLTDRVSIQRRQLALLERQIGETTAKHGADSIAVANQRIRYDQLTGSIRRTERQLESLQHQQARGAAGGPAVLPRTFAGFTPAGLMQGAGALGIATGGAEALQQLIQLNQEATSLALNAETIGTAFERATQRAGVSGDAFLDQLRQASRGTVEETQLMLDANRALGLGVGRDIQEVADLLAIARQRGKDFGIGTSEAFDRIVLGLGKAEPEILDELGILIDANRVYKDYAASIGTSANELTKQQKVQAVTNEVLRQNQGRIAENARAELDSADQFAQARAVRAAALTRIGQATMPATTGATLAAAGVFDVISGGLSPGDLFRAMMPGSNLAERGAAFGTNLAQLSDPMAMIGTLQRVLTTAEQAKLTPGAGGGTVINQTFNIGGSVVTEKQLTESVYQGLREKQQQNGQLSGLTPFGLP